MKQLDETPKVVHEHNAKLVEQKKKAPHPSHKYVLNLHYPDLHLKTRHFTVPLHPFDSLSFRDIFNYNANARPLPVTRLHATNVVFTQFCLLFHALLIFMLGARGVAVERWLLTILGVDITYRQKHGESHSLQGKHGKTHGIC